MNFMLHPWVRVVVTVAIGVMVVLAMSRLYNNIWIFWVGAPIAALSALLLVLNAARASGRDPENEKGPE